MYTTILPTHSMNKLLFYLRKCK